MRSKDEQIAVIKFLKSAEYQEVLKKYANKYKASMDKFEAKYE
jgi:hypothetical protein